MTQAAINLQPSWCQDTDPMILGEIFSSQHSVAVWQRDTSFAPTQQTISDYYRETFTALGMGVREVFSMSSLQQGLTEVLPQANDAQLRQAAIEDIYLLSDMLTCLFNCDSVGLRLAPLTSAMCPSFHTDNIPVRLVCTYLGPGTEWLPQEAIQTTSLMQKTHSATKGRYHAQHVQQMSAFDVGLLKGKAWDNQESMAALHRSCQLAENQQRVLLTLDPM